MLGPGQLAHSRSLEGPPREGGQADGMCLHLTYLVKELVISQVRNRAFGMRAG